ncbi:hypothetical protein Ocin01_03402 [Orchesella cincta]|uniref:Uncharacterized protein n=1 Tax=Orchesella cincta TaxID=48709 RepID=A0A1D2NDG6_ORCCI|nr:hypothetical protein Ocin01_03402 [Orchesella cincta]
MCLSLRGGTYYGASIHITIGLLFLAGFFVDLLGVAEIWHNPYATYFSLILAFIYILLFIVFGLLIFRGAEEESDKLLKGSIAGFVALQISAFLVYLVVLAVTNSIRNSRRDALLPKPTATMPTDLSELEAILEEASIELKHNQSDIFPDIILQTTPTPENLNLSGIGNDDESIISIYQVAVLVAGALGTFAYTAVVVMYVREVNSESGRIRAGRR